jgi:hypothetical protein
LTPKFTYHDENGNEIQDAIGAENHEECLGASTYNQHMLAYVEFFLYE